MPQVRNESDQILSAFLSSEGVQGLSSDAQAKLAKLEGAWSIYTNECEAAMEWGDLVEDESIASPVEPSSVRMWLWANAPQLAAGLVLCFVGYLFLQPRQNTVVIGESNRIAPKVASFEGESTDGDIPGHEVPAICDDHERLVLDPSRTFTMKKVFGSSTGRRKEYLCAAETQISKSCVETSCFTSPLTESLDEESVSPQLVVLKFKTGVDPRSALRRWREVSDESPELVFFIPHLASEQRFVEASDIPGGVSNTNRRFNWSILNDQWKAASFSIDAAPDSLVRDEGISEPLPQQGE